MKEGLEHFVQQPSRCAENHAAHTTVTCAKCSRPSFTLTTTTGHRVMATPLPTPTAPTAEAPKPKCSPPTVEELCLRTFCACWYLDKDWLVSFVASAQHAKPDSPITWVEFMPKGHMHLVRSALKLVPATKNLPLTKIKEVMFTFVLETLNGPSSSPGFFNARKAAKPRKRVCKRPGTTPWPSPPLLPLHCHFWQYPGP